MDGERFQGVGNHVLAPASPHCRGDGKSDKTAKVTQSCIESEPNKGSKK